jgi:hypothetical protein
MPPPIPLSSAGARYAAGSQSGSASSSANDGLIASQAYTGDDAPAIDRRVEGELAVHDCS